MMRWSQAIRFPRRKRARQFGGRKWRRTPAVEALEDRTAPAVLFNDTFDNGALSSRNWSQNLGVTLDVFHNLNDPSGPYSARFDGSLAGGELLQSVVIDLSNESGGTLSYYYERTGGGTAPAAGNDLVLEYRKADASWIEIDRQVSGGPSMSNFAQRTISLPQDALHSQFQFRFRTLAAGGDWFVDNVKLATTTGYSNYWSDQSWTGDLSYPNTATITFPNTATPTGNGSLTIIPNANVGGGSNYLSLSAEGNSLGNVFVDDGKSYSLVQATIPISKSLLQTLAANGSIQLTISPSQFMSSPNSTLNVRLEYPIGTGHLPPIVDLNGPNTAGINFSTTFQPGQGPVLISDPTATMTATVAQPDPAVEGIYGIVYSANGNGIWQVNGPATTRVSAGGSIQQPVGVAVAANGDLLDAEYSAPHNSTVSIIRVNPLSGSQEVFSSGDSSGQGIAVNRKTGDIYLQDALGVMRIDPVTGAQTPVPGGLAGQGSIAVESDGNLLLGSVQAVVRLDPKTGTDSIVTSGGYLSFSVKGIGVEPSGQILAVTGDNNVVQIDPVTGAQVLLTHDGFIQNALKVIGTDSGTIYVLDFQHNLIQVDPVTGQQTLIPTPGAAFQGSYNLTSVTSPLNPTLQSATITLTNPLDGSAEILAADTSGTAITSNYDAINGVLHLTGADSPANYQKVLRTVTYNDTASSPNPTTRQIQVIVNDGFANSAPAISSIVINVATASSLVVAGFPSPTTAGLAGSFTITAKDSSGNVVTGYTGTVHFASSDTQAGLPTDYTFTATDAGQHTFSATLKTAGSQSLTATDTVTNTITGSQTGITVNPAAANSLVVSGFPSPTTAGVAGSLSVTAKDAYGNIASGYTGTVHLTSSDSQAGLPGDYTFTATDAGQHTFSATLKTEGTQSLTATDTVTNTITGSQTGITVNPAAASSLVVSGFTSTATAGVAGNVTVTADDPYGNTAASYTGTIHFTSSDGLAALPANYTFMTGDAGVHNFSATLKTAGTQSLTATDTVTNSITGSQTGITVNPAAASTLVVSGYPSPTVAGVSHNFTVTAQDAFGNTATGYTGTVTFNSGDSLATLPANYAFVAGDAGQHTFSATLKTAGSQSLTATDTVTGTITGSQTGITVNPAATAAFVVAGYPSPITSGTSHNFTVTAIDPFGNLTSSYTGTVTFSSSDFRAALPANYTFTSSDAGVHTFSAILRTAGSQSITAKDTVTSSIIGIQTGIMVNPGTVNHLILSRFPSITTAGVAQNFRITAQDLYGNTVPSFTDTVAFSSTDAQAVLPANYTFTSIDAGIHTFSAALKTVGTQSLTAKDTTTTTVTSATRSGITVNPAATSQLQISGFPSSVMAGTAYSLTVTAFDPYGNVTPGYRGAVAFTSSDAAAALPANYTFTSADAGMHSFMATLKTAGTQSITVTDTVSAGITGTQSGITVVAVQPTAGLSGPTAGVPGQPLTYTLSASESGLPATTTYSFSIQWGDGSPVQTLSGTSGTQVGHVFTTTGTYTVSLTATDPSGNASVPTTLSVAVSTVLMETDPYNSSLTALYVGGTTGNDTIAITPVVNNGVENGVKVGMNFVNYGSFFPTGHVVVYGQSGNDIIKTAPVVVSAVTYYVNVPALFFAGNGNDVLNVSGSAATDTLGNILGNVLVGGAGADTLLGGLGRDILIGGSGLSTVRAGSGGDILIGGTTDFDNNAAALAAVLAEWDSADAYATRIARINGSMSGGLNGSVMLNSSTIHSDGQVNDIYGGPGMDWFFAGMMDVLFNHTAGEVITQV